MKPLHQQRLRRPHPDRQHEELFGGHAEVPSEHHCRRPDAVQDAHRVRIHEGRGRLLPHGHVLRRRLHPGAAEERRGQVPQRTRREF